MRTAGVILAGGRSLRMGGNDKALVMLNGAPMLDHVLAAIGPHLRQILINSNTGAEPFQHYGLPVLPDSVPGRLGPLAGLLTGMTWAAQQSATHVISVPCDTPLLPADLVPRLTAALAQSGAQIAIACDGERRHPTLGIWPVHLAGRLAQDLAAGTRAMHAWLNQFLVADIHFGAEPLCNLNTPGELAAADRKFAARKTFDVAPASAQEIF